MESGFSCASYVCLFIGLKNNVVLLPKTHTRRFLRNPQNTVFGPNRITRVRRVRTRFDKYRCFSIMIYVSGQFVWWTIARLPGTRIANDTDLRYTSTKYFVEMKTQIYKIFELFLFVLKVNVFSTEQRPSRLCAHRSPLYGWNVDDSVWATGAVSSGTWSGISFARTRSFPFRPKPDLLGGILAEHILTYKIGAMSVA